MELTTAWSWFSPESFIRRRSRGTECPRFEPAIVVNLSNWTGRSTTTTMKESRMSARIGEKRYLRGISIFCYCSDCRNNRGRSVWLVRYVMRGSERKRKLSSESENEVMQANLENKCEW